MSYHGFGNRIRVELRVAGLPLIVLPLLHGLVHWAVMIADLPSLLRLLLLAFNAWALAAQLRCWAFPSLVLGSGHMVLSPDGRLWRGDGKDEGSGVRPERVVWLSSRLVVLIVRLSGQKGRRWLILLDPGGHRRDLRRLRVHLRWGRVRRFPGPLGRLMPAGPVAGDQDRVAGQLRR